MGNKRVSELDKTISIPKKDVKLWLVKQAFWQVHIPLSKEINHPCYEMTKSNEHHQFDLFYVPHNIFVGNTHK